ncbi:hypothetical protein MY5147_009409 [Beauveria neobassiana]
MDIEDTTWQQRNVGLGRKSSANIRPRDDLTLQTACERSQQ